MHNDEFLEFINQHRRQMQLLQQQEKAFIRVVSKNLFDLAFECYPEIKPYRYRICEPLRHLSCEYAEKTLNELDDVEYYLRNEKELPETRPVPCPLTEQDAEKEIQEFIREFPEVDPGRWRRVVGEDFVHELHDDQFKHRVHREMKKGLTDFFIDHIQSFDSEYLRLLDRYLFLTALAFVDAVYDLEAEIKEKYPPHH